MPFDGSTPGPGRPKGSRNKLGEAFIEALYADFKENGIAAILAMRATSPGDYVKVVANLLPREIKAEIEHRAVMRMPTKAQSADEWLMKTITESSGSLAPPRNTLS